MHNNMAEKIRGNKIYKRMIFPLLATYMPRSLKAIHIELTNACNLKCAVCFSQNPKIFKARKRGFIEFDQYKKLIDQVALLKHVGNVGLNYGGESLLHGQFIEMLEYADKKNIKTAFTTNGTLFNDKIITAILKYRVDNIIISLDAIDEQHDILRMGSNIGLVEENIKKIVSMRKENKYPKVSINITHSVQNETQINSVIRKWITIVDSIIIYPCITENLKYLDKAFFDKEVIKPKICPWPFYYMAILWNGDVTTCCHDINGVNIIGNVRENDIKHVWKNNFKNVRNILAKECYSKLKLCKECETWKYRFKPASVVDNNIITYYSGIGKTYKSLSKDI